LHFDFLFGGDFFFIGEEIKDRNSAVELICFVDIFWTADAGK